MLQSHNPSGGPAGGPAPAPIDRPIVLVGLMGVGKTTVGRRLALRMNLPFVDADHEIEAASGMTVAEIFAKYGEEYFRDGERRVIARLIDGTPKVIATGGGAFINDDTRALILRDTVSVWLSAHPDILVERVGRRDHRGTRPHHDHARRRDRLWPYQRPRGNRRRRWSEQGLPLGQAHWCPRPRRQRCLR